MELPKKVKAALAELPPFKKVVVGLSGGMDSVVLTHVLTHLGYEVIAAHLNHSLRGAAADDDEAFVVEMARAWDLAYITKKAVIPSKGNMENNARNIRYSYLEEVRKAYDAQFIAVGHHFDDQIETILMHEKRGSGLRGKRGMQFIKGRVIRPLLDIPRDEIEAYGKANLLDFVIDESNFDLNFERNRMRHRVIPSLKIDPTFEDSIRKMSQEADKKLAILSEKRKSWLSKNYRENCFDRKLFKRLSRDLKVEILLHLLGQEDIYSKTLGRLINFIENGKTGKEVTVKDSVFVIEYDKIRCVDEVTAELSSMPLSDGTEWGSYHIEAKNAKQLRVRTWQKGDRFRPTGMKGHKKLQDFFVDVKIPRHERKQIPIIVDENNDIICVGNLRFSESHKHLKDEIQVRKNK